MLKSVPLVIRLRESEILKADLAKELRIDRHRLDHELANNPGAYAWWASLRAEVSEKLEDLKLKLGRLEARLTIECRHEKRNAKAYEVKGYIRLSHRYRKLKSKILKWEAVESILENAVKAFEHRQSSLMAINANTRKEKEHTHE